MVPAQKQQLCIAGAQSSPPHLILQAQQAIWRQLTAAISHATHSVMAAMAQVPALQHSQPAELCQASHIYRAQVCYAPYT
jgi:hypothetical protein